MSRRRGEFEHRTSIFEGAFRAWSHLGGQDPEELEVKAAADLDPLTNPIIHDTRLSPAQAKALNPDGTTRREYPYEPLPRSGLAHPYVQAILSPWLGPDADNEAIQLGLTTLRTWWQHRRKGESGSAVAALGTEKMKGVVEGYTRHFFTLAHCLVINDKEQPPRTLLGKMKELDKLRSKRAKKRNREDGPLGAPGSAADGTAVMDVLADPDISPLERLHFAQVRQLAEAGGVHTSLSSIGGIDPSMPIIKIKSKCIPGKVDLPGVVDAVNRHASQLAHRGTSGSIVPAAGSSSSSLEAMAPATSVVNKVPGGPPPSSQYGDPNTTPVVFVSSNGDIQIAMSVDGITCAHCVKIVETVLKGCNGNKSPIDGLLDAAADRALCKVLIKIDKASSAKRIAFEAARNLAMVGYTAKVKEMNVVGEGADEKATMDLGVLSTAFEVVANTDTDDVFDWSIPCTCPDNGVLREDCSRHSQMNTRIFDSFERREQQVTEYMAGCGMKYGMSCTCGPDCRCKNCPMHSKDAQDTASDSQDEDIDDNVDSAKRGPPQQPRLSESSGLNPSLFNGLPVDQSMEFFGLEHSEIPDVTADQLVATSAANGSAMNPMAPPPVHAPHQPPSQHIQFETNRAQRNPSIISYGNGLRGMSLTSETTFGRAMSGLSALSIDWENLEDFDVEVDHSAHINNAPGSNAGGGRYYVADPSHGGARRSSLRRSYMSTTPADSDAHVSFKV